MWEESAGPAVIPHSAQETFPEWLTQSRDVSTNVSAMEPGHPTPAELPRAGGNISQHTVDT